MVIAPQEFIEVVYGGQVRGVCVVDSMMCVWVGSEVHAWDLDEGMVYMPKGRMIDLVKDTEFLWREVDSTTKFLQAVDMSMVL